MIKKSSQAGQGTTRVSNAPEGHDEIADAAREWLSLIYAGSLTGADRARFEAWLNQSPSHREAFARAEGVWSAVGLSAHVVDWVNEPVTTGGIRRPKQTQVWPVLIGIAAAAALLVLVAPFASDAWKPLGPAPDPDHYVAGIGEIKTVALEDGTVLTLSASSAVDVLYSRAERQIDVIRGSAYFDVAHDEDRPLMVDAGRTEVLVLGTAFGIRLGPKDVRITVSRGRVSIAEDRGDTANEHRALTTIGAGRQIVTDLRGGILSESDADLEVTLAWMHGQLVYDGASLADVVADISRYRAKPIEVPDPAVARLRVTTSFRADQAERFMAGLPAAYPVSILELPDRTVVAATSSQGSGRSTPP